MMANNSKKPTKVPTGQKGRSAGPAKPPSAVRSASAGSSGDASSVGRIRTGQKGRSAGPVESPVSSGPGSAGEVGWERRKAWPLLLGGTAALTGLSAINYSWADPDGRLTDKAQDALSSKFPGATVRVHGRDAIITGLRPGADTDAAHDLVRRIEGVRNVKEGMAAVDSAVAADLAGSIAQDSRADTTAAVTTVVARGDAVVASEATEAGATPGGGAPAETTIAPPVESTTAAPPTTVASAPNAAPTTLEFAPADSGGGETPEAAPPMKIFFDSESSALTGDSNTAVDELVAYLDANPDVRIKVVGHADGWGTRLTNLAVSRARAGSVVSALVSGGVGRDRVSAIAHGDRFPVASNATAEGRAANRRVEIVFFGAEGTGDREVAFTG